jgi:hypothetical protein
MEEQAESASNPLTSRRHFLDLVLGASNSWLAGEHRLPRHPLSQTIAAKQARPGRRI